MKHILAMILVVITLTGCSAVTDKEKYEEDVKCDDSKEILEPELVGTKERGLINNNAVNMSAKMYIKIEARVLNIRDDYSVESNKLAKTYANNIYKVIDVKFDEEKREWNLIEYSDELYGWVAAWECLQLNEEEYAKETEVIASIYDSTKVMETIIGLNKIEVLSEIGSEDHALWDSIEMDNLYHIYEKFGFAVVYEMNDEGEVTDESKVRFVEMQKKGGINSINMRMNIYEIQSILGESEYIDYEFWHYDMGNPFHWIKLEYNYPNYILNVFYEYDSNVLSMINIEAKDNNNLGIDENAIKKILYLDKSEVILDYEFEEVTLDWHYRHEYISETDDVQADYWIKLIKENLLIGFHNEKVHVIKVLGKYSLNELEFGDSMSKIREKLGNLELQYISNEENEYDIHKIYYVNYYTKDYRMKYISNYYSNKDELELFIYKNE